MTELSAEAKAKLLRIRESHPRLKDITDLDNRDCYRTGFQDGAKEAYLLGKQESLAELEKLEARIEALRSAVSWYAAIGEDDDSRLEDCLLRAMDDRINDKTTINLGGKYIAETALKALAEDKAKESK